VAWFVAVCCLGLASRSVSGQVPGRTLVLWLPACDGLGVAFHGVRPGRVPRRGVAEEGSALLETARAAVANGVIGYGLLVAEKP
jgi:hypothetical protein